MGAFKTAEGGSKFAQLRAVEPLLASTKTVMPVNPATVMMAVALFSIEQQLGNIAEMEMQLVVAQAKVNSSLADLEKRFKYYRLSLYTFSMASMLEIMLGGNFKEEYIIGIKDEISGLADQYRELFSQCSIYLEKMSHFSVEANVLKGIGKAGKAVGKFVGKIPVVKEGPVDEFLRDSGAKLKDNAIGMQEKAVRAFAECGNPGTRVFTEKMEDMIQIYNHTSKICFDNGKIYLIAN